MKNILPIVVCCFAILACQDMQSQKEDIHTTKTGYRYQIYKDVDGPTVKDGQYASIHVVMSHGDSVMSDTRKNPGRPTLLRIEEPEKGPRGGSAPVQDLLRLMSVGDSARLYYPIDSFPSVPDRLKQYKEVTYDVSVVDIFETEEEAQAYLAEEREKINAPLKEAQEKEKVMEQTVNEFYATYKRGEKDGQWQTTPSGLKYIILEKSGATKKPQAGEVVRAHYYGIFVEDGMMFDNSYRRGEPLSFPLGQQQVIKGWDEGFALLDKGDKAVLYIPSDLAYGERGYPGAIPPNADLIFFVDLVGIGYND